MDKKLSYSGITAKVSAMKSRRLTDTEFKTAAASETVPEVIEVLRRRSDYEAVFKDLDPGSLHRREIEQRLYHSLYRDFQKLYLFATVKQREFLSFYFMHFEIELVKRCFLHAAGKEQLENKMMENQDNFFKYSKLDNKKLSEASDLNEFCACLEGSPYEKIFTAVQENEQVPLFEYEVRTDLFYFTNSWNFVKRLSDKKEREALLRCYGSRMDLLNIQWVYRGIKYYHLQPAKIYELLIPRHYRLKKEEMTRLASSGSLEEFDAALSDTFYGKNGKMQSEELEQYCRKELCRIYTEAFRRAPCSAAVLNSYLYLKEEEIHRIITLIESVRYQAGPEEILSYAGVGNQ